MKLAFGLFFLMVASVSWGEGGPKVIELTAESAKILGFSIAVENEGPFVLVKFKGPKVNPEGCPAFRSGTFLLGSKGEELLVHVTEIKSSSLAPEAMGYYADRSNSMGVFIDYLCPEEHSKSARYSVTSISQWLITNR